MATNTNNYYQTCIYKRLVKYIRYKYNLEKQTLYDTCKNILDSEYEGYDFTVY